MTLIFTGLELLNSVVYGSAGRERSGQVYANFGVYFDDDGSYMIAVEYDLQHRNGNRCYQASCSSGLEGVSLTFTAANGEWDVCTILLNVI